MHVPRFWLLVSIVLLLGLAAVAMEAAADAFQPPTDGDWVTNGVQDFTGRTDYCNGTLLVASNSVFTIENSVLTVRAAVIVQPHGTILVKNSTIKFDCTWAEPNRFHVLNLATCTIMDGDDNYLTTDDMSLITSTNDIPYNFTVFEEATFELKNSVISKCGRSSTLPDLNYGLAIRADDWTITDSTITDGYYGIIVDNSERGRIENVTIENCYVGLYMLAAKDTAVLNTQVSNNTVTGIEVRGFNGNLMMSGLRMEGNGVTNFKMVSVSGYNIEIMNNVIGPVGGIGMELESVKDTTITQNSVTGCDLGVSIKGGDFPMSKLDVSDCTEGVRVTDGAIVRFVDLDLTDTTITVDPSTDTNITSDGSQAWTRVTGDLATDVAIRASTTITIESSDLAFRSAAKGPTGLWALRGGTLKVLNSTVGSPVTHDLICHVADGSRVDFKNSVFSNLGASTSISHRMGMFVAGSGTIEEVTLNTSLVGLVLGGAQTNILNLTIRDCLTGIMADGSLGRSGVAIRGLTLEGCDVAIRAINQGSVSVLNGRFMLSGEGFNLTTSTVVIKDSYVSDPGPGMSTAVLRTTSILDFVNTQTSRDFDVGPTENMVSIYWYLNLTMRYLTDGSPLSDALVTVREASGVVDIRDRQAGADGILEMLELREMMYIPSMVTTTPHTVTVKMGALSDSFTITMDASTDHVFYMDNYPPVLLVDTPEDGTLFNVSTITFQGQAWDAMVTDTEGLASMRYRVDDGNWTPITLPVANQWSFDAEFEDGYHVVEIQVHDRIGNVNSTMLTLEVDTVPPPLSILSPEDGLYINYTEVLVRGHTDPEIAVTVDGTAVPVDENGFFNTTVTLVQGPNVILVVATDSQGVSVSMSRSVTVDTVVPEVVLDQEDLRTNQETFTLSGTKKADATIYVNGFLTQFFGSTTFETVLTLGTEGLNAVDIWSEDLAGNNWSTSIIILRDTTPPELYVGSLPLFTNEATVMLQGTTDDPDAIVTVNGETVTLSGLAFTHTVTLVEGENTITVEAVDELGNAAEPSVQVVTLSTVAPSLTITTAKKIETLEDEYQLDGETDPGLPVNVHVVLGGYSKKYNLVAGDDGAFSLTVALPQIGNHSVTVTVTNEAGNKATEEVFFVRNRQEPTNPSGPSGPSWLDENWAYVILAAAIIGALAILIFTVSSARRKREALERRRAQRLAAAQTAPQGTDEEEWDEEPEDEVVEGSDDEDLEEEDDEAREDDDEEDGDEDEARDEEDDEAEEEEKGTD